MKLLTSLAALLLPVAAWAGPAVKYELSFDNAAHHEARITVTYSGVGTDPLQLRMSRSSPGRYAMELVTYESDERNLSRSQKTFRSSWLGAESDGD
jgi:hypothetical protein